MEASGDALRVTFQVDDVHSGARIWSQTISPVLESVNSPEAEKAATLAPYDAYALGDLGLFVAFTGHWDEGNALAEKALKLAGPSAAPVWRRPAAKRAWFRGEYQEAYEAFQRAYIESFWLSHLDLAYTLPFSAALTRPSSMSQPF